MESIIQHIANTLVKKVLEKAQESGMADIDALAAELLEDCKEAASGCLEAILDSWNQAIREDKSGRREKGLVMKEKDRRRTLLTKLGEIQYSRDYYYDKQRKHYTAVLDDAIGVRAYERVGDAVGAELAQAATGLSYARSARLVTGGAVSRQTVRNKILATQSLEVAPHFQKRKVRELHIFADEDHVHMQKPHKARGKQNQQVPLVTVTEGIKNVDKRRRRTINPMHFVDEEFNTKRLWEAVGNYIMMAYDMNHLKKIYVHGDGGSWIKHGLDTFAQAEYVMDGYHFEKSLKQLANRFNGRSVRYRIHQALAKNDRKKADAILQGLLDASEDDKTTEKVKEFATYLLDNWDSIVRRQDSQMTGSCTESQISHVLSERFSRDPLGWSKPGLGKLSKLRIYVANGGRITNKDLRDMEAPHYSDFTEKLLNEAIAHTVDWSIVEEREPIILDPASGTQTLLRSLGRTRNPLC